MTDAAVMCRCAVLNNLSGDVADDYARKHLDRVATDGLGRPVHRCPDTDVTWTEERSAHGYGEDVVVLRRLAR
jgi:hypothetical protein